MLNVCCALLAYMNAKRARFLVDLKVRVKPLISEANDIATRGVATVATLAARGPFPRCLKTLCRFIAHCSYYTIYRMSFSASLASIASPVRQRFKSRITFGPMRS